MTSYSLYLLKPTSSEIRSQNKPPGKVTKTVSPGPVARNNPENTVIQSKLGIKTAETETAKVSQSTSSKPLNAPVPPNLTNDKNKSNADDNQDNPEIDIIEAAAAALKQPDPVVYSVNRNDLLKCDKTKMETFSIPWIAACAREGTILYKDASLTGKKFQVAFLQQFAVLDKSGDKLKLKELGKPNPVIGWASMKNLIYLPRALKDERTSVYQKIVFTYINDRLEPGEIGDVTFYKSPGSDQPENILKTRSLDNLRYANVYNWEKNDYEDSQWVLIGNYPSIESVAKDKNAFNKTLYGWCKTTKLFPWYSRMALIPNNKYAYIFKDGPALTKFYSKANKTAAPEPGELLAFDSYKMWKDSKWPFFLEGKFNNPNLDYVRLICLVNAGQTNITGSTRAKDKRKEKRVYLMKFGYAVEKDPRDRLNQFKNVYLFRKSEINKIKSDLDTTLALLKPRKVHALWKELTKRFYGEEYDYKRTINEYAKRNDGITYKELSILFDKTQQQIYDMDFRELDQIEEKILKVKARLDDLVNDKTDERVFGPSEDSYIWLYEEELP